MPELGKIESIEGFLPFRLNCGQDIFTIPDNDHKAEYAQVYFRDVINPTANAEQRMGMQVTQVWPGPLELMYDNRGLLVYSYFNATLYIENDQLYFDEWNVRSKTISFLNAFIEIYRLVMNEPYIMPLRIDTPLLKFKKCPTIPDRNGKGRIMLPIPGSGLTRKPWIMPDKIQLIKEYISSGIRPHISEQLLLDANEALITNRNKSALLLAQIGVESGIDKYLLDNSGGRYAFNKEKGWYEWNNSRAGDVFERFDTYLLQIKARTLKEMPELWNDLELLKGIRNSIGHRGIIGYEAKTPKYYKDRDLVEKTELGAVGDQEVNRLLESAFKIIDWLIGQDVTFRLTPTVHYMVQTDKCN